MKQIVINASDAVTSWVNNQLGGALGECNNCIGIGVTKDEKLIAGVVFNHFDKYDVAMTVASTDASWLSRGVLYVLFSYAFVDLGCVRVTALTKKKNKHARSFLEKLGFEQEGRLRRKFGKEDGIIYGMLKRDCKWIREDGIKERLAA
jgi:RimJ/RimL family protein N-acetyltransferase